MTENNSSKYKVVRSMRFRFLTTFYLLHTTNKGDII